MILKVFSNLSDSTNRCVSVLQLPAVELLWIELKKKKKINISKRERFFSPSFSYCCPSPVTRRCRCTVVGGHRASSALPWGENSATLGKRALRQSWALTNLSPGVVFDVSSPPPRRCVGDGRTRLHVLQRSQRGHLPMARRERLYHGGGRDVESHPQPDGRCSVRSGSAR